MEYKNEILNILDKSNKLFEKMEDIGYTCEEDIMNEFTYDRRKKFGYNNYGTVIDKDNNINMEPK